MRYCPYCGHQNLAGAAACTECGAALGVACPACGQLILPGSRFCSRCGAWLAGPPVAERGSQAQTLHSLRALMPASMARKIDAAPPQIAGERREVTVLHLSIEGYALSGEALDSEQAYLLTDQAMHLVAEVIYEYEGIIDQYTGDGVVALFGLPVAHENDPERAVRAALALQTVLGPLRERLAHQQGLGFSLRGGVHTGPVIAGQMGSDRHVEYTVLGDTLDRAERLQRAAEPEAVLASFPTYQRTRPLFEYRALPPLDAGPTLPPLKAFQPLRLRVRPGQVRGLPGLQVPMVGRQEGLARLHETMEGVYRRRQAAVVCVTGEAGVGKSRLVGEFSRSLAHPDVAVFQGNCLAHARAKPLWILSDILRAILHVSQSDPADVQRQALERHLQALGLSREEVLPHLLDVLFLGQADGRIEARLRHIDGAVRQKLTHTALRQVLLAQCSLAPTVYVFEDLHWIDPGSRAFLEHLIETLDAVPLLLILVSRELERESVLRPLIAAAERRLAPAVDLPVEPLSAPEAAQLVDQLLSHTAGEVAAVKQQIVERAGGNPFYAEEMVRMLLDQGGLVRTNGSYRLMPAAADLLREVPGTLRELIQARLDRLPGGARDLLRTAAVLGPVFPTGLLLDLYPAGDEALAPHLRELEARQFLAPLPSGAEPGHAFHHALIQEVVYGSLLKRDRQRLHDRAAETIEGGSYWLPDEQVEALAYHYARGSDASRALPYLLAAAENAARRCANETAVMHFRHALQLAEARADIDSDLRLRVQMGLGQALKFVGEYAEASRTLKDALRYLVQPDIIVKSPGAVQVWVHGLRELADIQVREGGPGEAIAYLQAGLDLLGEEGALALPHLWRLVIDRLAWVRFRQGELEEAFDLANSAVLSLDPGGEEDPMTLASLYNTLGGILWQKGNLSEAAGFVGRSLDLYGKAGYLWGTANAHSNLGILNYRLGNWQQALSDWQQALTIRRAIGDIAHEAVTLSNLGHLRLSMGCHAQAREDLDRGLALGQRLGEHWVTTHSLAGLAQLAAIQGNWAEAQRHAQAALELAGTVGSGEIEVQARWILALAQAEDGNVERALDMAGQALDLARKGGMRDLEADCLRVLGTLRARTGQWLEAETHLHESIEVCLQQQDPYRHGLALLELGRLYHQLAHAGDLAGSGWQSRALEILHQAAEGFTKLGAAHDLGATQALLGEIQSEMAAEAPSRLPEGEWRTAAVVWLRLEPPPGADEEAVFEATALALPALSAIAEEYKGRAIRRRDGLTVVFGAPTAFEDDTERAVQAASRLVAHLAEAGRQSALPLACRVAVGRGSVVAGHIGPRFHAEFVVKGAVVDELQRMAGSVPPGEVWVTDAVRTATHRLFEYEAAPLALVAAVGDPLVCRLVGLRERPAPTRGLPGMEAKFVGREAALESMADLARNLDQGLGGLVWIEGEPGIGKSRLMREFTARLAARGLAVWRGRCIPHRANYAFSLFHDLLAHTLGLQPSDSAEQIRARLDPQIERWPRDAQATRPHLEVLLGVEPGGFIGERLRSLQPEELQRQIFVALRKLFKSMAAQQPLVIVMDDLHWIDPVSAELLLFLLTMVSSVPILFVCAQRRQGADSPNDRLVRTQSLIATQTLRLRLERLSYVESEMLLAELLSQPDLPPRLSSAILKRSEGNPYFIEEYVRMFIEQDHLQYLGGRWVMDPHLDLEDLPLPSSLETLIRARLDALPAELKQLVQYGAVVGSPFEVQVLEAVAGLPNVQAGLARLESRLLAHPAAEAGRWQFNHSVVETVAYGSMLAARRRALHLQVAETLEARWRGAEAEHAEELAYHFLHAGEGGRAVGYLVQAGERAAARYANQEALNFLQQAAHHLDELPDAPASLRGRVAAHLGEAHRNLGQYAESKAALEAGLALAESAGVTGQLRADLYRELGETAQKQGDFDAACAHLARALDILGEPGDRDTLAQAARLVGSLAWTYFLQGRFDEARQACQSSLAYAERGGALNELARVENTLGGIHVNLGEWEAALHHATRAMVLREQLGYTWGVASTLNNLGILALLSGQWSKAWSFFERSLALRQEIGDVEGIVIAHANLGMVARDQGQLDLAEHHLQASLEVGVPFGMSLYVTHATIALAHVQMWRGDLAGARQSIASVFQEAAVLGAKDVLAEAHQVQAEYLLATGAWAEARDEAAQAAALAVELGNRGFEAAAWRRAAEAELERGDLPAAREAIDRSEERLRGVTNELQAGRTAALAGRIGMAEGRPGRAEQDLRKAREIFSRLGASRDLQMVQDTVRRLPRPDVGDVLHVLAE